MERFTVRVIKPFERYTASNGKHDRFTEHMDQFDGQTIEVEKGAYEGWFRGEGFNWHRSWLEFPPSVLVEDDAVIDENDY